MGCEVYKFSSKHDGLPFQQDQDLSDLSDFKQPKGQVYSTWMVAGKDVYKKLVNRALHSEGLKTNQTNKHQLKPQESTRSTISIKHRIISEKPMTGF